MPILRLLAVAAACAGAFAFAPIAAAQTTLKMNVAVAQNSPYGVAIDTFAREVEQRTGGRYKIQNFYSAALGAERESIEAVQLGTLDLTMTSTGPVPNFVPDVAILDIPFLFRDYAHARAVLDGPIGQDLLAKFPPKVSELTFTNAFCWAEIRHHLFCEAEGHLLITYRQEDCCLSFYPPVGPDPAALIGKRIDGFRDYYWTRLDKELAARLGPGAVTMLVEDGTEDTACTAVLSGRADLIGVSA